MNEKQDLKLDADIIIDILEPAAAAGSGPHLATKTAGMIHNTKLLNASDTAFLLQYALGPLRAWTHFLADMRREHSTMQGHRLTPASVAEEGSEHPMYMVSEIRDFIRVVRQLGCAPIGHRVRVVTGTIDLSEPDWRKRVITGRLPASA